MRSYLRSKVARRHRIIPTVPVMAHAWGQIVLFVERLTFGW
jgi:hypothetical protein